MAEYLRLKGIRKSFGTFQALSDIDLTIEPGEFVCFLGPSGCGKTTLLRIVAGLETQTAGSIFQAGRDISTPPAERDYASSSSRTRSSPTSVPTTSPMVRVNRRYPRRRSRRGSRAAETGRPAGQRRQVPGAAGGSAADELARAPPLAWPAAADEPVGARRDRPRPLRQGSACCAARRHHHWSARSGGGSLAADRPAANHV
jgi:iron(III) transport system ATP-binding protein